MWRTGRGGVYEEFSPRNQKIIDDTVEKVRELLANGASPAEIKRVIRGACTEVAKNVGETTAEAIRQEVQGLEIETVKNRFGLSKDEYLHTIAQDINMFYLNTVTGNLKDREGKIIAYTGAGIDFGIANVWADAFGTSKNGLTGGLRIEALNVKAGIGYVPDEVTVANLEAVLFKVGAYARDSEGKVQWGINFGYGVSAGIRKPEAGLMLDVVAWGHEIDASLLIDFYKWVKQ